MQTFFNVLSLASFAMSSVMFGGTLFFYTRIPTITDRYINQLTKEVTSKVTELMPEKIDEAMPKLPTETGLPF
tara:strand:- start:329 stop:547 length:219 start_codon:yes stop_codon:yes gene_type:complete